MRSERGQVSAELMGIFLLVALVIAAVVSTGIAGDIGKRVDELVCQIGGGQCGEPVAQGPEKCLLSSTTNSASAEVFVAFVEVGKKSVTLREEHSDGSVTFTIVDSNSAAGKLLAGGKAKLGKYGVDLSGEATAGGMLEGGRVFEFANAKDAKAFEDKVKASGGFDGIVRDLTHANDKIPIVGWDNPLGGIDDWALDQVGVDDNEDLGTPDATYVTGEAFVNANGGAGVGVGALDAELKGLIAGAGGVKHYTSGPKKGETEVYVKVDANASGSLTAALFGAGGTGGGEGGGVVKITLDDQNQPKEFSVKATAGYTGALDLKAELEGKDLGSLGKVLSKAALNSSDTSGGKIELEGTLDLTDPANRDAVFRLLGDPAGRIPGAIDVAGRLKDAGKLTVDTFDTQESKDGGGLELGVGVGGGGEAEQSTKQEDRTAGWERLPGGTWQPRVCKPRP